ASGRRPFRRAVQAPGPPRDHRRDPHRDPAAPTREADGLSRDGHRCTREVRHQRAVSRSRRADRRVARRGDEQGPDRQLDLHRRPYPRSQVRPAGVAVGAQARGWLRRRDRQPQDESEPLRRAAQRRLHRGAARAGSRTDRPRPRRPRGGGDCTRDPGRDHSRPIRRIRRIDAHSKGVSEAFIGGFLSGLLSRGFLGTRVGYGFYFTTARLFGVDPGSHGGSELTATMGGYIDGQLMPSLPADENDKLIERLERVKDFELAKDQIKRIELKRPGSYGIGFGRITVVPDTGHSISIQLRHPVAYDRLVQLTQAFSPDVVRTRPFLSV